MPITLTNVVGPIVMPNGAKPKGAVVVFQPSSFDKQLGVAVVAGGATSVALDGNADFSASLAPRDAGQNAITYNVSLVYSIDGTSGPISMTDNYGPIVVPMSGPVNIESLIQTPMTTPTPPDILAQALAAQAGAAASANNAEQSATAADVSAQAVEVAEQARIAAMLYDGVSFGTLPDLKANIVSGEDGDIFATMAEGFSYTQSSVSPLSYNGVNLEVNPADTGGYHIDAWGTAGDGVTEDGPAFALAINAVPDGSEIFLGQGKNYKVNTALLPAGKKIRWVQNGGKINSQILFSNWVGEQVGFASNGRGYRHVNEAAALDERYVDNYRDANYTGGLGGQLDWIERWRTIVRATVGSLGERKAEKAVLFENISYSDFANAIAAMFRAEANAQGAVWAGEFTTSSKVSPTTFAHRCAEFAISATGDDDSNLRYVINIVTHGPDAEGSPYSAANRVGRGIVVETGSADCTIGALFRDHPISGSGFINQVIDIESDAEQLIRARSKTKAGSFSFGSFINTVADFLINVGTARNSAELDVDYTRQRHGISDNVNGAESGIFRQEVMSGGSLVEMLRVNGGNASNPVWIRLDGTLKQVKRAAAGTAPDGSGHALYVDVDP